MFFSLDNVSIHYDKLEAVRGISMDVAEGTIVGILGPNGAGKSSTIKAISGQIKLACGEIWYQGNRIDGISSDRIISTGIVQIPEGRRVFPRMTVIDNLRMGAYWRKDKNAQIVEDMNELFEYFPILRDRKDQNAGLLSGGEQEQLAIARALMAKPKLLLMDEPCLGLSPIVVEQIEDIIRDLNKRGMTIILVEPEVHLVLSVAHMVYIMENGQTIMEGSPGELSATDYVQRVYLTD